MRDKLPSVSAAFYAYQYIHMRENKATMEMEWVDVSENRVIATCTLVAYDREMDRRTWDRILRKLAKDFGEEMSRTDQKRKLTISGREKDPSLLNWKLFRKLPVVVSVHRILEPFTVETLEGTTEGNPGDWLICGVAGELYPCSDEVFRRTYEEVSR